MFKCLLAFLLLPIAVSAEVLPLLSCPEAAIWLADREAQEAAWGAGNCGRC